MAKGSGSLVLGTALSSDRRSDHSECSPGRVYTYTEADPVKDVLQKLVFGPGLACPALGSLPRHRYALVRQDVDVDELKGTHFGVQLPSPDAHGGLLDDLDDVTFLWGRGSF